MTIAKPRPPLLRSVAAVLIATLLTGCMIWEPAPLAPQVIADSTPSVVRVTLLDGDRVEVRKPYIVGDSLIGGRYRYAKGLGRVAFPLNEIAVIETPEIDGNAMASLVVGYIFLLAGLVTAMDNSPPTGRP